MLEIRDNITEAIGQPSIHSRLSFVDYRSIVPAILTGMEAGWPDAVWTMAEGEYKLSNEGILYDFGVGPVLAWHGEQIWEIFGNSIGTKIVADLNLEKMANFGVRVKGFWCESTAAAVTAMLASVAIISQGGFNLDKTILRFRGALDQN